LVAGEFDLSFTVKDLPNVVHNLKKQCKLADSFFDQCCSDEIVLEGLLGIDLIQHLNLNPCQVIGGSAFKLNDKIVPYGSTYNFVSDSANTYLSLQEYADPEVP